MVPVMLRYATAAVTALLLLPAGAGAQGPQAPPSDPEADSPSGTVYELPLERGRKDAAPRERPRRKTARKPGNGSRRGGSPSPSNGAGASGGGTGSPIRSENNFGSSSRVPGVDEDDDRADAGGSASGSRGDGNGRPGGTAAIGIDPGPSSSDGPTWGLIVPLIAMLVLLGVTAGTLAGRARRS